MTATINASTTAGVVTTADTSGILQLQTNGTAALTVDASQNVGIGTSSPTAKLHVSGDAIANTFKLIANTTVSGSDATIFRPADNTMAFSTNGAERARIDSSGNVGIGTTSPDILSRGYGTTLGVSNTSVSGTSIAINSGTSAYPALELGRGGVRKALFTASSTVTEFGNLEAVPLAFFTNSTERARIDSSGNLLVGKTSMGVGTQGFGVYNTGDIEVNAGSNPAAYFNRTNDGTIMQFRRSNTTVGTISVTTSATAYNTSSDYRLKEAIAPMTGALAKVALLKPVTYKWKIDGSDGQGFIAHELDEVVKGCVTGEKDAVQEEQYEVTPAVKDEEGNTITEAVMGTRTVPAYQGIDTSFLVATLTAAIQELKAIVDAQGAEIAALKGATA